MEHIGRMQVVDRDEWLVKAVAGADALHVGCTDHPLTAVSIETGRILHAKLAASAKSLVGIDYDAPGIEALRALMSDFEFIVHDAERMDNCLELGERRFDIVVAADVVEHLSNVGLFLSNARRRLRPGGQLLITTPHAFAIKRMAAMMLLRQEYVHPDHTAYFSLLTLRRVLDRHGFRIVDSLMFQWVNPTVKNRWANAAVLPFLRASGGRLCDEIIVVAEVASTAVRSDRWSG